MVKKRIRKIAAVISASVMLLIGCISAMPASAATTIYHPISGSALTCSVTTQQMANGNKIRVDFNVINSPAIQTMGISFKYSENLVYLDYADMAGPILIVNNSSESRTVACSILYQNPNSKSFTVSCFFEVKNINNTDNSVEVGIFVYNSATETSPNLSGDATNCTTVTTKNYRKSTYSYMLGDANNSGAIEQIDAYYALNVANQDSNMSVAKLNAYLDYARNGYKDPLYGISPEWVDDVDFIKFGEVLDVDGDGYIRTADAQAILEYNSKVSLGQSVSGLSVGKTKTKTIIAEV